MELDTKFLLSSTIKKVDDLRDFSNLNSVIQKLDLIKIDQNLLEIKLILESYKEK